MSTIKSFSIYREYWELMSLLSEKEQANILLAICKYMFEDENIKLSNKENVVFINLKRPLDKSKNKSKNGSITTSNQNQNEIKMKSNQNQNEIKNKTHQDVNVIVNDNVNVNVDNINNLYDFIESNFNRTLNSIEYEEISNWEDNELTRYAIKQTVLNGIYNIKYISIILSSYKQKNITTIQQAQADDKKFKEIKNLKNNRKSPNWVGQEIPEEYLSDEELEEFEKKLRGE